MLRDATETDCRTGPLGPAFFIGGLLANSSLCNCSKLTSSGLIEQLRAGRLSAETLAGRSPKDLFRDLSAICSEGWPPLLLLLLLLFSSIRFIL